MKISGSGFSKKSRWGLPTGQRYGPQAIMSCIILHGIKPTENTPFLLALHTFIFKSIHCLALSVTALVISLMKSCFIYKELIEFEEVNDCSAVKALKKFVNVIKLNFGQDI